MGYYEPAIKAYKQASERSNWSASNLIASQKKKKKPSTSFKIQTLSNVTFETYNIQSKNIMYANKQKNVTHNQKKNQSIKTDRI